MDESWMAIPIVGMILIGLPWMIFHYITKWKSQATLTTEDENLLDELHDLARRLDDRMCSIERIMSAENPNWRSIACDPASNGLEDSRIGEGRFTDGRFTEGHVSNQPVERIRR
jgi:phage shock protein B